MPTFLDSRRRRLTDGERRLARARIRDLRARGRRAHAASLPVAGGVVLALWLWTILASDAPWIVVTPFWVIIGGGIALWVSGTCAGTRGT